ncbi:DegT/DnrJ/EryC1/StrS family aminotransferase [Chitinispirillales bacterium ANBcel5]|uniref:DegT/DnrJ/EryC1/StrS family aminotransferase n=1 Tax=Cellulosispirillum alkaliphilum TaxID=3039283 RepID=UPI002A519E39|nr:DegT/DnrJ/EryC1/StrS family aminotransferase [Chitinispirillales bacterium ANBcel5]
MRSDFLVYGSPQIGQEEIDEVLDTIHSGWLGTGPKTQRFEKEFATYQGIENAVAVSSCTAAIHLALLAAGVGKGDEVIIPALTFCATANAVIHAGARPVFADIREEDLTIDPFDVERKISSKTRAVIPVHLYGYPADMASLRSIASKHNLHLIQDAAHAAESEYRGKKMATYGDITTYSFYITKNLTTVEGGMVVTSNREWADKIKVFALHGMSQDAWSRYSDRGYKHYQVSMPGYKYNMTDIQASFGLHQLNRLETSLLRRDEIWNRYDEAFCTLPFILPPSPSDSTIRHAKHIYALRVANGASISRDECMERLYSQNIGSAVHYTSLHLHPYYTDEFGYRKGDFPVAENVGETTFSLPLSAKLTDSDVNDVIQAVCGIFK